MRAYPLLAIVSIFLHSSVLAVHELYQDLHLDASLADSVSSGGHTIRRAVVQTFPDGDTAPKESAGEGTVLDQVAQEVGGILATHTVVGGWPVHWNFTYRRDSDAVAAFEAWDLAEGWSAAQRPDVDPANVSAWPAIKGRSEGWSLGLQQPIIAVVSMAERESRRKNFKTSFESLCLVEDAKWAPALNGFKMPPETVWLRGADSSKWVRGGDAEKPGAWGCFATHLAILREAHDRCSKCDVVVMEDDAVFIPEFKKKWQTFLSALPDDWDVLRLGGQSLWEPPYEVADEYIHAQAVSNTWGYVVRANRVHTLANKLAEVGNGGVWGIDAMMQLYAKDLKFYVPPVPLIYTASSCSDSSPGPNGPNHCGEPHDLVARLLQNWPLGWTRTYCEAAGAPDGVHTKLPQCQQNPEGESCCPYKDPKTVALASQNSCDNV